MNPSLKNHARRLARGANFESDNIFELLRMFMREPLPEDGADYPCSFEFRWPEPWRCPKPATEALDEETYNTYNNRDHHKNVLLHGRALCEIHLVLLDQ